MKLMWRNDVLCWAGLAAVLAAAGCGASTGRVDPPGPEPGREVAPVPSKPAATRAGAKARGPQGRPAQFLDPKYGK